MQFNTGTVWETQQPRKSACKYVARWLRRLEIPVRENPLEWIQNNISLSHDPTSVADGNIKLDAWQIEPILAQFSPEVRIVVMMALEQIGKSTIWRMPVAYKMLFEPAPRWIIYESDIKAEDVNRRTFDPILRSIPQLAELITRTTANKRSYTLVNGSITDFSGAGADITSKAECDGVADEVDRWGPFETALQNLRNFIKRFRTFWRKGQGCLAVCSSPKTEGGKESVIATVFEETDQGYWYLRCQSCRKLTMRSCDIHNLQWEVDEFDVVIESSLRLKCPKCGHEHPEADAQAMTDQGEYVSKLPTVTRKRGFQVGALGVPRVFSWFDIAEAQMKAGSTASPIERADFYNSWRGLPLKNSSVDGDRVKKLQQRITPLPPPEDIDYVLMACDTQDDSIYYVIRAFDFSENSYLVQAGNAVTWDELSAVWSAEYLNHHPLAGIIDAGGHGTRPQEVAEFVEKHRGFFSYKGNPRIGCRWKPAKEDPSMIIANTDYFKPEMLYRMYQAPQSSRGNWFIHPDPPNVYLEQMADMKPNNKLRGGHAFNKWDGSGNDHLFDCEKEIYVINEVVKNIRRMKKPKNKPNVQDFRPQT